MDSNAKKKVIRELSYIDSFEPKFDFGEKLNSIENKTKENISHEKSTNTPNYKKYKQQEFYNIVYNNKSNNTDNNTSEKIAANRIKILLSHYGKHHLYFD